jgi:predicted nucleic acid-binding protein
VIFVDTGAWFASIVPSDHDHTAAASWLSQNTEPLLTTDYVVDETLTLLQRRGEISRARSLGEQLFNGTLATIYYVTEADIAQAWETFYHFTDKEWSFTDCASKVIIEKLNLPRAFAFDHHFRQFGTVIVVP